MSAFERPRRETNIRTDMTVDLSRRGGGLKGENGIWETLGQVINNREREICKADFLGRRKFRDIRKYDGYRQTAEESNVQIHQGIRTKNSPVSVMARAAKLIKGKLASTSSFSGCRKTGMGVGMRPTFIKF